jgi:NIMA (never in mitosis gene a)-related kinase 1/4/5
MDRFKKLKTLGRGSFGAAILVRRVEDHREFVIKRVDLSRMQPKVWSNVHRQLVLTPAVNLQDKEETRVEIDVLSHLSSPCIVKYYEHFVAKKYLCIVMEYCDGGDLSQKARTHPPVHTSVLERPSSHLLPWAARRSSAIARATVSSRRTKS